jgi:hypothetical protein
MAQRQAQLPRTRVEVRQGVAKNWVRSWKSNASRLGVSCSALFGFIATKWSLNKNHAKLRQRERGEE